MIDQFIAVVPAHNEEDEIGDCLQTILLAIDHATDEKRDVHMNVVVVADDCTDGTQAIVESFANRCALVAVVPVPFGNVGRARNAGGRFALQATQKTDAGALARTWIAFTDADSRVPQNWIISHLDHAQRGAGCVVGTVEPRAENGNADLIRQWHAEHRLQDGHNHIFGANLGIRASLFDDIRGCPQVAVGEDGALVAAVTAAGGTVHRTDDCRVLTSARLQGRCRGGFATYLQGLVDTVAWR
ncbi:glycosyltransferase [Brevibacterium sp.]|uniref:glycosyltransferase n=1 Tax=Brevibacterium sp. TaxID=1701 RepID=UPI0028112558|nr:glycosyltransferase [Brevibacterium sp.]